MVAIHELFGVLTLDMTFKIRKSFQFSPSEPLWDENLNLLENRDVDVSPCFLGP